jgi:hypothetical protein
MHSIELTDDELCVIHEALHAYLDDFGHKRVIAKLQAATSPE